MILAILLFLWALIKTLWGRSTKTLYVPKKATTHRLLPNQKAPIALIVPAHNEKLVIEDTIKGALKAGLSRRDIYVVDDSSTDGTFDLAKRILGANNVLKVKRSGRAGAMTKAIDHFKLISRYGWVQTADADSIFSENYFSEVRKHIAPDVIAVIGQVKSLRNNWITSYRAFEYTIGHDFYKYIESFFNLITVMPGPATLLSTKVLSQVRFSSDTLTEDFDITMQVHRLKMGRIAYAPRAHTFTQDPPSISAYIKQIYRWYSGFFQVLKKHRVGTKIRAIDFLLLFLAVDGFFYPINLMILGIFSILKLQRLDLEVIFATDFMVLLILVGYSAWRNRRWDILAPLPLYYIIRLINLGVFFWAPLRVLIFSRGRGSYKWNTPHFAHSKLALSTMKGGV